eukprot:jgi/Chlat1/3479/Chrsp23S03678
MGSVKKSPSATGSDQQQQQGRGRSGRSGRRRAPVQWQLCDLLPPAGVAAEAAGAGGSSKPKVFSSTAPSISRYYREPAASVASATAAATGVKGKEVVVNPNSAQSSEVRKLATLVVRRRKERLDGKSKPKLSTLKKVILKERLQQQDGVINDSRSDVEDQCVECLQDITLDDNSDGNSGIDGHDAASWESECLPAASQAAAERSRPASSTSPAKPTTYIGPDVNIRYVDQIITTELNKAVLSLLAELLRFQERATAKDPIKAKKKRRLVFGLREVAKSLRTKRARCIIVTPNIEEITSEGGLDCTVDSILAAAKASEVPVIFALTRSKLGQVIGRRARVSIVAVFDYDGADLLFKEAMALANQGREEWAVIHHHTGGASKMIPTEAVRQCA